MESYRLEQLTVFVENRSGELLAITLLLEDEGISLTSITLADSTEFGLLRLLTPEVARAKKVLLEQGFMAQSSYVLGVKINNHIGSFNRIVRILASVNVDIRYTYTVNEKEFGIFIFKLDDEVFHTAMTALLRKEVALLRLEDL
ncbi:amino acid-binding protein [Sulfurospirillum sp. T05]|uniref:Amino acid-binding protein n=1 Tax=Sulfurospirillum tamanense TaxID=2813362 RepID=A0ABS2WSD4_9BACT|nr:amino acid-binding protein [Sulfurospirillum tamanensis]MBN2964547.1 amino acid-binding protein [Sulfurospirillum tamanensis]